MSPSLRVLATLQLEPLVVIGEVLVITPHVRVTHAGVCSNHMGWLGLFQGIVIGRASVLKDFLLGLGLHI